MPSSRSRSMSLSTPADSTAGVACDCWDEGTVPARDDSMLCVCAMIILSFRDRSTDDECKHECEYGKPFHDRRRRHRDPENRRLALAGIDRGSATLALQDGDVEQGNGYQNPTPNRPGEVAGLTGRLRANMMTMP